MPPFRKGGIFYDDMAHQRKKLGDWGESVAATHLQANGYNIVARNWRCRFGEIDLIACKDDVTSFVEVRTRKGRDWGTPETSITKRKANKLTNLAWAYIGENELDDLDWQIDLVAVELDQKGKLIRCEHIPNIVGYW